MAYATLGNDCTGLGSIIFPVPLNSSETYCGISGQNVTFSQNCCTGPTQTYLCYKYCSVDTNKRGNFARCTNYTQPYCQGTVNTTLIRTVKTGSGIKLVPGLLFLLVLFTTFANAHIVHSLGLERRDASSCNVVLDRSYTRARNSQAVSAQYTCSSGLTSEFCYFGTPFTSELTANNRTLNDTSAADSRYDGFFDILGNRTYRYFPAMSSIQMQLLFPVRTSGTSYVGWTPLAWCVNGTVTGCTDVVPNGFFDACGPLYTSDIGTTTNDTIRNGTIQGVLIPVQVR